MKNRNSNLPVNNPPTHPKILGGDGRNRTDDPLLAKQVLYQLSYIPKIVGWAERSEAHQGSPHAPSMVGQGGLELNRPGIPGGSNSEVNWSHDEQDNEQIQP